MKKTTSLILAIAISTFSSCGALMDGFASAYGGGTGNYNPYANFWNNSPTTVSSPSTTFTNAEAENAINGMISTFWDHPENIQSVPATAGGVNVGSSTGTTRSGNSSSTTRTPTVSQHNQCNGTGKCNTCNGSGMMWVGSTKKQCTNCGGNGRCRGCNGTGRGSAHYY